jgi:hypothetical protein
MTQDYPQLVQGVNDYIDIQRDRHGLISIVQFSTYAAVLYQLQTRHINSREGFVGDSTDFGAALRAAIPLLSLTPPHYESRIVFFTDGQCTVPSAELRQLNSRQIRMDVVGYGSVDRAILEQLRLNGGLLSIGRTIDDVSGALRNIAATD